MVAEMIDLTERRRNLLASIPDEGDFDSDFMASDELADIGQELIEIRPSFERLQDVRIGYCDFVIWCAADHCRDYAFTNHQLEALVHHELSHIGLKKDKDGRTKYVIVPHDLEMFTSELEHYGTWRDDLVRAKHAFDQVQAPMPGFGS